MLKKYLKMLFVMAFKIVKIKDGYLYDDEGNREKKQQPDMFGSQYEVKEGDYCIKDKFGMHTYISKEEFNEDFKEVINDD